MILMDRIQMKKLNLPLMLNREEIHTAIVDELIPLCAKEDKAAQAYLNRLFFIVRKLDDLWDEDHAVTKYDLAKGFFMALNDLPLNTFFIKHQSALVSVQVIAFNAWMDANELVSNQPTDTDLIYAHVLRDYICEIFPLVAYFTGGETHMRKVSMRVRKTFEKSLGE